MIQKVRRVIALSFFICVEKCINIARIFISLLFLLLMLLSFNTQALQFLKTKNIHDTVKQKLDTSYQQSPHSTQLLIQLKKDAKRGNTRSQFSLANMYKNGIDVKKDEKLAFYWYFQVAKSGYSTAQFNVAQAYYHGIGIDKNFENALIWYEKSAQQGFVDAQYKLANIYHHGKGVTSDYAQAYYWYKKATESGLESAQLGLAQLYEKGLGIDQDLALAQYWYEKSAIQSNAQAQYALANLLDRQLKPLQALLMYQKSAEQNFPQAQFSLAAIYHEGRLVKKDDNEALKLALLAAKKKDVQAQLLVARIYHQSNQVQYDLKKAMYWYQKAAEQDNELAKSSLIKIKTNLTNEETKKISPQESPMSLSIVEANIPILKQSVAVFNVQKIRDSLTNNIKILNNIKTLRLSAKQGNSTAQHNLSLLFSTGYLFPKNDKKAFILMQKAAQKGRAQSQNSLAIMYFKGIGVKADYQSAYFWANASAKQNNQKGKQILLYLTQSLY